MLFLLNYNPPTAVADQHLSSANKVSDRCEVEHAKSNITYVTQTDGNAVIKLTTQLNNVIQIIAYRLGVCMFLFHFIVVTDCTTKLSVELFMGYKN
jgi:hypothetical protein